MINTTISVLEMSRLRLIVVPYLGNPKVYIHGRRLKNLLKKLVDETKEREMKADVGSPERRARIKRDREGERFQELNTRKRKEKQ